MRETSKESEQLSQGPLSGYRVLDFTRVVAGPWCTMQLADLGAEVIKIEHPNGGDDTRHWGLPDAEGESFYYLAHNRSKKGIILDLSQPQGRAVARELAGKSDVIVENFRPGVMGRMGLDYPALSAEKPELVYCGMSAYGQSGPMSDRPGYDPIIQAEFGMMSITGEVKGVPLRTTVPVVDTFAALYATIGVVSALLTVAKTGKGQFIDVSLMSSGVAVLGNLAQYYFSSGKAPPRMGNDHPNTVPTGLYFTRGGPVYVSPSNDRLFQMFCCEVIDAPDLLEDPRFATIGARARYPELVRGRIQEILGQFDRDEFLQRMRKVGVPAGAVRDIPEALESAEIAAAGLIKNVKHPSCGDIRMMSSPIKFSRTPVTQPAPPPQLGEHTTEVLRRILGYNDRHIAALRESGVIG